MVCTTQTNNAKHTGRNAYITTKYKLGFHIMPVLRVTLFAEHTDLGCTPWIMPQKQLALLHKQRHAVNNQRIHDLPCECHPNACHCSRVSQITCSSFVIKLFKLKT